MEVFIFIIWLIRSLATVSEVTYYWQLKEYRWDRLRAFLLQQKGHQIFFSVFHAILLACLILFFFLVYLPAEPGFFASWFAGIVSVIFLAESLRFGHRLLQKRIKRPALTAKAILIMCLTMVFELLLLYVIFILPGTVIELNYLVLVLLVLSLLDHDINAVAVFLLNRISKTVKKSIFKRARSKRLSREDLVVIGITGSYAKTSVKEFLSHILSGQFSVLKTEKNTNTEIGIANTILKRLKPEHEVFIAEMGAYGPGEVKLCCYMTRPQIGIFTGLNEQHLALFGSLDNTFHSKWELISFLADDGLAVFNGDSEQLKKRIVSARAMPITCGTNPDMDGIDALAKKVTVNPEGVTFTYRGRKFSANVLGSFQAVNLMMCIVVAEYLGMPLKDISERIKTIKSPAQTMSLEKFEKGFIIDDSYNVNPDGLKASLEYLDQFPKHRKIVFFPGILELGEKAARMHEEFGEIIARHGDQAFFFDPNFADFLKKGALAGGLTRENIHNESDQTKMIDVLKKIFKQNPKEKFVILFESRGAEKVLNWIRSL